MLAPALVVLTLTSTLVLAFPDENPSLNRSDAAIPVVFLVVGLAFSYLWRGFLRERIALGAAGLAALVAAAGASAQANARSYFTALAVSYDAVTEHAIEIAAVIRRHAAEGVPIRQQYLLAVDYWVDARNIALELDDPAWTNTNNLAAPRVPEGLTARPLVFVYKSTDADRLAALERLYPGGSRHLVPQSYPDRNFSVYLVR
jgi:hypothetical protein